MSDAYRASAFELSRLWQKAFAEQRADALPGEQPYFRQQLLLMRTRVEHLVSRIQVDMPHMTVHDVTHLDALWEIASIIAGEGIDLNPPEAFVFGGAVLLHDAAMTLAAYANGLADLARTVVWQDTIARLLRAAGQPIDNYVLSEPDNLPESCVRDAIAPVLRQLHAQHAEALAQQNWSDSRGESNYLIEDSSLRHFYGPDIGQIAHSHWWDITKVEQQFGQDLGALATKTRSRIDRVKIACLLRVADAAHLDARRSPHFLRLLIRPLGIAEHHWAFQEKLATPNLEGDALVFTAGARFGVTQAPAWWLCFDTLRTVDRELRDVALVLQDRGRGTLSARRVKGVESPDALARMVQTDGWRPVDTSLKVSNLPALVRMLAGDRLYGSNPTVPLRELLQNAADAIDARRRLERRSSDWGEIYVALNKVEEKYWLIVEDSGVGMSERVLVGPLLDFGTSFWSSELVAEEFQGLIASGLRTEGRYGIGFFSVFMLGDVVEVTSRRYDRETTLTLSFGNGIGSRPILRKATVQETPRDGGTRVAVQLNADPFSTGGLLYHAHGGSWPLDRLVANLAPALGVTVSTSEGSTERHPIRAGDWLRIAPQHLTLRLNQNPKGRSSLLAQNLMRPFVGDDGTVYGRAYIRPASFWSLDDWSPIHGWITVGGLRAARLSKVAGILLGEALTAARDSAWPLVPAEVLAEWATEQGKLIMSAGTLVDEQKAEAAEIILECGGDIGDLPIASVGDEWLTSAGFKDLLNQNDELLIRFEGQIEFDDELDDVPPKDFRSAFEVVNHLVIVPKVSGSILAIGPRAWPAEITGRIKQHESLLADFVRRLIVSSWGDDMSQEEEDGYVVGSVYQTEITRTVTAFRKSAFG
jgi:hypothetical protein